MIKNQLFLILIFFILVGASLACKFPNGRERPDAPIPVTTEAADQFVDNFEKAVEALRSGEPFSLTITEAQLTSIANIELQSIEGAQIQNLQIYLRDGQIQAFGDVVRDGVTLPVGIVISVSVGAQGQINYLVQQALVGPFPIPESVITQLTDQLDRMILNQFDPSQTNIIIDQITIANGVMIILAHAL